MITKAGSVSAATSAPYGSVVSMRRFWPSTLISLIFEDFCERGLSFSVRSSDALTSSGVIASPSWNFTFSRMWKRHVVGLTASHLSASCGVNSILSETVTSVSPAPMRVTVQPSHSCAGSTDSPNQYRAAFKCLPAASCFSDPQPARSPIIRSIRVISTYSFFIDFLLLFLQKLR